MFETSRKWARSNRKAETEEKQQNMREIKLRSWHVPTKRMWDGQFATTLNQGHVGEEESWLQVIGNIYENLQLLNA